MAPPEKSLTTGWEQLYSCNRLHNVTRSRRKTQPPFEGLRTKEVPNEEIPRSCHHRSRPGGFPFGPESGVVLLQTGNPGRPEVPHGCIHEGEPGHHDQPADRPE